MMTKHVARRCVTVWIDKHMSIVAVFLGPQATAHRVRSDGNGDEAIVDGWLLQRFTTYRREHWQQLCEQTVARLGPNDDILIVGPGQAKHALRDEIEQYSGMKGQIRALQTEPRMTDQQLVALSSTLCEASDRNLPEAHREFQPPVVVSRTFDQIGVRK